MKYSDMSVDLFVLRKNLILNVYVISKWQKRKSLSFNSAANLLNYLTHVSEVNYLGYDGHDPLYVAVHLEEMVWSNKNI